MILLRGLAASGGCAIGEVYCYRPFTPVYREEKISLEKREEELSQFSCAMGKSRDELEKMISSLSGSGKESVDILSVHLDMIDDEDIRDEINGKIKNELVSAYTAVWSVFESYISLMSGSGDEIMRAREADLRDVRNRILRNLDGKQESNLKNLNKPIVLAAYDLLPADTASMKRESVLAIATETGGKNSHSAILARSYGIPAVLSVSGLMQSVRDGQETAVDGTHGQLFIEPDGQTIETCRNLISQELQKKYQESAYLCKAALSSDGTQIQIGLNIGGMSPELKEQREHADEVGLFRTEFLYMRSERLPTEEEQFSSYREILETFGEKPVVLRTLDAGGDKAVPCLAFPKEENPFLGKRALRFCFDHEDIFRTQLRAALRAAEFGRLRIMFPMVGSLEDFRRAKNIAMEVGQQLDQEGIPRGRHVQFGVMIEIPSAAIIADQLAEEVDFASIGTNDLFQYTLAADRGNPAVAPYCSNFHPAVWRLIRTSISAFRKAGKPICVCGELGGSPTAGMLLIGLGIRELSMNDTAIAGMKRELSRHTIKWLQELAEGAMEAETSEQLEMYLKDQLS